MACARLERLPVEHRPDGLRVFVAASKWARLLGLAGLPAGALGAGEALLIPRCRSVHTVGMRFAIDVVFLDRRGRVVGRRHAVPPWRVVGCRRAAAVLELPARPARR